MKEYYLSNHVHFRLVGENAIVLDLSRDEYLTLTHDQVDAIAKFVCGWPTSPASVEKRSSFEERELSEFAGTLLERRLLTTDIEVGKRANQAQLDPAEKTFTDDFAAPTGLHVRHAARFIYACLRTKLALRLRPIYRVVSSIEHRKRTHGPLRRPTNSPSLQELMSTYLLLRPFVYTQKENCLFDSLALVHFLASYRLFPLLVFGVVTHPFKAHAWVQDGRCSLNYGAEYVRAYSPIMVI